MIAKSREPGACGCMWPSAMGLLIDLCRHSALPSSGFLPAGTERLAQLSPSGSYPRTMQHEGEVLIGQRSWEVYFPNPGSACFPQFYSMLLDLGRGLASLDVNRGFERERGEENQR